VTNDPPQNRERNGAKRPLKAAWGTKKKRQGKRKRNKKRKRKGGN
jgi:hypothetical protein